MPSLLDASLSNPSNSSNPFVSDYDRFHNMNILAEHLCAMDITMNELTCRFL